MAALIRYFYFPFLINSDLQLGEHKVWHKNISTVTGHASNVFLFYCPFTTLPNERLLSDNTPMATGKLHTVGVRVR